MRRLISFVLCLFTMCQIYGYTAEFGKSGIAFGCDCLDISYQNERISFRLMNVSYGDVGSSGTLSLISDPYSSSTFKPSVKAFSSNGGISGTVYKKDSISLFSTTDYRYGIGLYYGRNNLESVIYYAGKTIDESLYGTSTRNMLEQNVLYLGISYNKSNCSGVFLSSISDILTFDSFVSFAYKGNLLDISLKMGNVAEYKKRKESKELDCALTVKNEHALIGFEYVHYGKAMYSGEVRPYDISLDFSFELGAIKFGGMRTIKTNRKGIVSNSSKLSVEYRVMKITYQDGEMSLAMKFDDIAFSISKDNVSVTVNKVFENETIRVSCLLKSGKFMEVAMAISN